jgi:hypothetical protein
MEKTVKHQNVSSTFNFKTQAFEKLPAEAKKPKALRYFFKLPECARQEEVHNWSIH